MVYWLLIFCCRRGFYSWNTFLGLTAQNNHWRSKRPCFLAHVRKASHLPGLQSSQYTAWRGEFLHDHASLVRCDLIFILTPLWSPKLQNLKPFILSFLLFTELQRKNLGFWHSKVGALRWEHTCIDTSYRHTRLCCSRIYCNRWIVFSYVHSVCGWEYLKQININPNY